MLKATHPDHTIEIKIHHFPESKNGEYVAWIAGDDYKGIVVSANTIGECVKELGASLVVLEAYRLNVKKSK